MKTADMPDVDIVLREDCATVCAVKVHVYAIHLEYHIKLIFCSTYIYLQVGRYWALVIGLSLYVVGFTLLTTMASGFLCHRTPASPSCVPETYGILICVGIAGGTVRANIPSFGAEQVILLKFLCVFPLLRKFCFHVGA